MVNTFFAKKDYERGQGVEPFPFYYPSPASSDPRDADERGITLPKSDAGRSDNKRVQADPAFDRNGRIGGITMDKKDKTKITNSEKLIRLDKQIKKLAILAIILGVLVVIFVYLNYYSAPIIYVELVLYVFILLVFWLALITIYKIGKESV